MPNPVLLDNVEHHDLKIVTRFDAAFGDAINQVLIFPSEFEDIQREYPIFFRKDEDSYVPVTILGLDRDENLFLDNGEWRARYIPALQQRMGFLAGLKDNGEPAAFFDPAHPRVGSSDGEPLFRDLGGNTPLLDRILKALRIIHVGRTLTAPMFQAFEANGLIRPINMELTLGETTQFLLSDFYTIDEDRLFNLDGAALAALNKSGFLAFAYFVLASRGNLSRLLEMKARQGR